MTGVRPGGTPEDFEGLILGEREAPGSEKDGCNC